MGELRPRRPDGTKIAANASKAANHSPASLIAEVERRVEAAQDVDATEAEAARHGQGPANSPRALRDHDARHAELTRLQQEKKSSELGQDMITGLKDGIGVTPTDTTDADTTDADDSSETNLTAPGPGPGDRHREPPPRSGGRAGTPLRQGGDRCDVATLGHRGRPGDLQAPWCARRTGQRAPERRTRTTPVLHGAGWPR